MAASLHLEPPQEIAEKVLRRAHVSRMTRVLQDRLALANVKIQNGWENLSMDTLEPQIDERMRMRRKRPASSTDTTSDTASTISSHLPSSSALGGSSPLTAPAYSDDQQISGSTRGYKRARQNIPPRAPSSGSAIGRRGRISRGPPSSWKKNYSLPESSPIKPAKHTRFASHNTVSQLSFISEVSTIPDDPPSPEFSEDDDSDLPVHSFNATTSSRIISSPPRTPPPADKRMRKSNNVAWSRTPRGGEEGADLLMYLATSPSRANGDRAKTSLQPPSTPPCKSTPLPSSHMTPNAHSNGFLGFNPATPGATFNFADFVNVSPSPAQAQWTRTPGTVRTSSTRRKLNFDPTSPSLSRRGDGLGMELGGALG